MTIYSLQRGMNYAEALRCLSPSGFTRWARGPLRGIAEVYLPYRLYKITIADRRLQSVRYYAVDAATGTLDPYEFSVPPASDSFVEVETRNVHPTRLDEAKTQKLVTEKVRRLLYSRGFFRVVNPRISAEFVESEFYLPYWVGFYGDENNLRLTVLNAVRRTVEGNKARRLVKTWLSERNPQDELNLAF